MNELYRERLMKDDFTREMMLSIEALESYVELSDVEILFEANEDNPEVEQIKANNDKAVEKSGSHLGNAIQAIRTTIAKIIQAVANFFQKMTMDKEAKARFEQFKQACAKDPSLANKVVSVQQFQNIQQEYEKILADAEKADKELIANNPGEADKLIASISSRLKGVGGAAVGAVSAKALENIAYSNAQAARLITAALSRDSELLASLEKSIGEKQAKKTVNSIKGLQKRISLRRIIVTARHQELKTLQGCVSNAVGTMGDLLKGKVNMGTINMAGKMLGNEETRDTVKKGIKLRADVTKGKLMGKAQGKADNLARTVTTKGPIGYVRKAAAKMGGELEDKRHAKGDYSKDSVIGWLGNSYDKAKDSVKNNFKGKK